MINRDYKGFQKSKPLFSRKKTRRKGILLFSATFIALLAVTSYIKMTPGEESEQQTTSQDTEILQLNLSSDETEINQPVELASAGEQSVGELSLTEVALKASRENPALANQTQEEVVAPEPQEPQIKWESLTVESGDSLAKILDRKSVV